MGSEERLQLLLNGFTHGVDVVLNLCEQFQIYLSPALLRASARGTELVSGGMFASLDPW